ncbi:MAG: hypothetical protein HYX37_04215 [Rhizobiales bacterium]|nr:hypothetical protein [Hyphomicrobiales bacterium]
MRAVKHSPPRSQNGGACHRAALCADPLALAEQGASSPPKLSHARTRAERDWAKMFGAASALDLPASLTRRRQPVIGRPGRIKAWRQT